MKPSLAPFLTRICNELTREHAAHTILLYGSRANNTQGPGSDYDIAAFAPRDQPLRDTRTVGGEFLDIFIYPEADLHAPREEHLKLRESIVLLQSQAEADQFLASLDALHHAGPSRLPDDEKAARIAWAWKMAARARRGDIEGHYRRVWLLTALLEDYFVIRDSWFEGPKRAFQWLSDHDGVTYQAFQEALAPRASNKAIEYLVAKVVGLNLAKES